LNFTKSKCGFLVVVFLFVYFNVSTAFGQEEAKEKQKPGAVETVIVTALKREQTLQDVAGAVSAYSGDQMARFNLRDSNEIAAVIPGLNIGLTTGPGNQSAIFLRGVGLSDFSTNNAGPVGVYIDELYISSPSAQVLQIFDLDRVEVLRGPQGTLYGRNTNGGAIKFMTAQPTRNFYGYLRGQYGRFETYKIEGMVNGPLSDKLRARAAFVYNHSEGPIFNLFDRHRENGTDGFAYRATLEGDFSDRMTINLMIFGSSINTKGGKYRMQPTVDANGDEDLDGSLGCPINCTDFFGNTPPSTFYTINANGKGPLDVKNTGIQGKLKWVGDNVSFTSITGFQHLDKIFVEDTDTGPVNFVEATAVVKSKTFTQEFQLAGDRERFVWQVGAFFLSETIDQDQPLDLGRDFRADIEAVDPDLFPGGFDPVGDAIGIPALFYRTINIQKSTTYAVFGHFEYDFTPKLTGVVGARYTYDKKAFSQVAQLEEPTFTVPLFSFPQDSPDPGTRSWSRVSWKVGLNWRPSSTTLVYGHVSTGFKSGGYNGGYIGLSAANPVDEQQPYDPETILNYEIGLKTEALDGRWHLNLAAFIANYKDIQVFRIETGGVIPFQILENASNATIKGFEAEFAATPADGWAIMFSAAFLNAKYGSNVPGIGGNRMIQAPKVSLNGLVRYEFPLGGSFTGALQVDINYNSDIFFTADNNPLLKQDGYAIWNASFVLAHGANWQASVYGKNIFGKKYFNHGFALAGFGVNMLMYGTRRSYNFELRFNF